MLKKSITVCLILIILLMLSAYGGSSLTPDGSGAALGESIPGSGYVTASEQAEDDNSRQGANEAGDSLPGDNRDVSGDENGSESMSAGTSTPEDTPRTDSAPERESQVASQAEPIFENKPAPVPLQDVTTGSTGYTCSLAVRCDTLLSNMSGLDPEKTELVPEDGVIFFSRSAEFYEGESVFNLLQRELKGAKIHLEFVNAPIYNTAYLKGINNLYEFDCGELSGWTYKVNDWFPGYGCSLYQLQEGDIVEILYTCDLGRDVGKEVE